MSKYGRLAVFLYFVYHRVDRVLGFFLQSSESGFPHPLTSRRVRPPPFWFGGEGKHSQGGEGGSQFRRGDRHCGTLGIYVLCVGSGSRKMYAQIGYSLYNLFKDHVFSFHVGWQNGNIFDATVFANLMKLYDMKKNFSAL